MFKHVSKIKKSYSKALYLTAVYAMHLLFFQALLAAPGGNDGSDFKPLFTHSKKEPVSHQPKHPAATYYAMLIKQGNVSIHSQTESPEVFVHTIKIATLQIINTQQFLHLPYISFHPGDGFFQLYRLVRVFLI